MEKPPTFVLIFLILAFFLASFNCYQIWFKSEKVVELERRKVSKLPQWFPYKEYFENEYQGESWLIRGRVAAIVIEIFIIIILTMNLFAWFK